MASGWHRKANTEAERERRAQYRTPEHRAQQRAAKAIRDSGEGHCWRCGRWLSPDLPVHAGHDDHDRTVYRGAECAPCSSKTAAKRGAQVSNALRAVRQGRTTSLRW